MSEIINYQEERNDLRVFAEWMEEQYNKQNRLYAGKPYIFHLDMVAVNINKHLDVLDNERKDAALIAGGYSHDYIEMDIGTYNDLYHRIKFHQIGLDRHAKYIAEIARACCNLTRGRNRAERMPDWIYEDIRNTEDADIVKIADRLANLQYSISQKSDMAKKYAKEHDEFCEKVTSRHTHLQDMIKEMDELVSIAREL